MCNPGPRTQQLPHETATAGLALLPSLDVMVPIGKKCPAQLLPPTEARMGPTSSRPALRDQDKGGLSPLLGLGGRWSLKGKAWAGSRPRGGTRRAGCIPGGNALPSPSVGVLAATPTPWATQRGFVRAERAVCSLPAGPLASPPPSGQDTQSPGTPRTPRHTRTPETPRGYHPAGDMPAPHGPLALLAGVLGR